MKFLVQIWWKRFFLALLEVGHTDMRQTQAWILPNAEEAPQSWADVASPLQKAAAD